MVSIESKKLAVLFLTLLVGLPLGCEHAAPQKPEVPAEVVILRPIEDVDDRASLPNGLQLIKRVFVAGSEPSDKALPRYAAYRYKGSQVIQSGESATVTVSLTEAKTGNPAGEVQWTLAKVGNAWKIKEAPLPAGKK
jgi:hypothetical protein